MRRKRVALIGLRGAGKSTIGAMLAKEFGWRCVELTRKSSARRPCPVNEIIALYGQGGYRRLERKALEEFWVTRAPWCSSSGGLVAEEETFNLAARQVLHGMAEGPARRAHGAGTGAR
jgi:XRE family aerobic/anaerobic benzoate catabolism transcriptional regulator